MAFKVSAASQQKWLDNNRSNVQERLSEPVLSFTIGYTTGSWGSLALGPFSPLVAVITRFVGKKKAGGLPQNFLAVVTQSKLHVFAFRHKGMGPMKIKDELAVWERSKTSITVADTAMTKRVTVESPSENERVQFDLTKGQLTDEFVQALEG